MFSGAGNAAFSATDGPDNGCNAENSGFSYMLCYFSDQLITINTKIRITDWGINNYIEDLITDIPISIRSGAVCFVYTYYGVINTGSNQEYINAAFFSIVVS